MKVISAFVGFVFLLLIYLAICGIASVMPLVASAVFRSDNILGKTVEKVTSAIDETAFTIANVLNYQKMDKKSEANRKAEWKERSASSRYSFWTVIVPLTCFFCLLGRLLRIGSKESKSEESKKE